MAEPLPTEAFLEEGALLFWQTALACYQHEAGPRVDTLVVTSAALLGALQHITYAAQASSPPSAGRPDPVFMALCNFIGWRLSRLPDDGSRLQELSRMMPVSLQQAHLYADPIGPTQGRA